MPVGALIAVLAPKSVADVEIDRFIASYRPEPKDQAPAAAEAAKSEATPEPQPALLLDPEALKASNQGVHATPLARRLANQHGVDLSKLTGTGKNGRISQEDVENVVGGA